jgi:CDGSH-type Zn-finger protein
VGVTVDDGGMVGALTPYLPEDFRMAVKITIRPNGPYVVEGEVELIDVNGARIDTTDKPRIALCRCGGSVSKPFCDGTHSKVGFQAAEAAVAQQKP